MVVGNFIVGHSNISGLCNSLNWVRILFFFAYCLSCGKSCRIKANWKANYKKEGEKRKSVSDWLELYSLYLDYRITSTEN